MVDKMRIPEKKNSNSDSKIVMKINELLGSKKAMKPILIVVDMIFVLMAHILYNFIVSFFHLNEIGISNLLKLSTLFSVRYFRLDIYLIFLLVMVGLDLYLIYKLRVNYSMDLYNVGQKGTQRFTTLEEIKEQYKEIPEKDLRYEGDPGFLITRYADRIYIDTSPVNNLIIGMTRSGKGECLIFPLLDIYSRAENQPSMIVTDLKLDMYPKAKKALEERGYEVYLYNLIEPSLSSFRYNPLTIIVDEMKRGNVAEAENLCNSFCYSVYFGDGQPDSGDSLFFANTSTQLVSAAILALISDCLEEDSRKNSSRMDAWIRKQEKYKQLPDEEKEKAKQVFLEKKNIDQEEVVWKVNYIPDNEKFIPITEGEKKINVMSLVNTFTELARVPISKKMTLLDFYFQHRPEMDRAKFLYSSVEVAGDRTKGNIMSNALSKLTPFSYSDIAQLTAESTIKIQDIGFGDKPIAIFVGIPDYDHSKDFYLSIFNRQVYYILAKLAAKQKNGKTKRIVKFVWDEFGNSPAVDAIDSMITSGLGRGLYFDLVIQAFSQLEDKYGRKAQTIRSNCGNKMYLLSDDLDTAKEISELLGTKTVTDVNRMGAKFSLNKTFTESWIEQPLKFPNDLMNFREGEAIVLRTMKRKNLAGKDITSYPIYCDPENGTRLKYRYTYLTDTFPNDISYVDVVKDELSPLDMTKRVWNYKQVYSWINEELQNPLMNLMEENQEEGQDGTCGNLVTYKQIVNILKNQGIEDKIDPDMSITKFITILKNLELEPKLEKQIINLVERGKGPVM